MQRLYGEVPIRQATSQRWWLILALLCVLGFAAAHYAPQISQRMNRADPSLKTRPNLSDVDAEDLLQHLDNAISAQTAAAVALHRSCNWMDRAQSSLDADQLAGRRLQLARSASQAAEERIIHSRDELQITRDVLIERSTHREH